MKNICGEKSVCANTEGLYDCACAADACHYFATCDHRIRDDGTNVVECKCLEGFDEDSGVCFQNSNARTLNSIFARITLKEFAFSEANKTSAKEVIRKELSTILTGYIVDVFRLR